MEEDPESLVTVVRIRTRCGRVHEVANAAVAVHQSAGEWSKVRVGYGEPSQCQALSWGKTDQAEPLVKSRVMKLGEVNEAVRASPRFLYPICSPQPTDIGFDELAVARLEVDLAPTSEETTICRGQAHDVGHVVGPFERQGGLASDLPAAILERRPPLVLHPAMRR